MIPEDPKEELLMGCQAVCCLSQTAVLTGAAVKMCQPFEHIASLNCEKVSWQLSDNISAKTKIVVFYFILFLMHLIEFGSSWK